MLTENQNTELWAVHAQGPDDIYPAYDRADAERHAAELNAIPTPPGISVAAVVIPSPLAELDHWKGVAELEREHKLHLLPFVAPTDANLSAMRREGLSIDGDNAYKRDLLDAVVGALAFGKQRSIQPPAGHWLERFYEIGKAEADERDARVNAAPAADPISITAVAVTKENDDGELYLDWLIEGGIAELEFAGQVLMVADREITDNEGSGEVFTRLPAAVESLHITHRPLIRNAIGLLGMRRPVAPDVERVINSLEAMLEGQPTSADAPSAEWLYVAGLAEGEQA